MKKLGDEAVADGDGQKAQQHDANTQKAEVLAERLTGNILKQIEGIMDSDTLPELTDGEYENIQNIQDELARSGLGTADTLKQNLFSTKLQQMHSSDDPMTSSRSTPATIASALKGPQAWPMQDTAGPPRKAVKWESVTYKRESNSRNA